MQFGHAGLANLRVEVGQQELADQRMGSPRGSDVAAPGHEANGLGVAEQAPGSRRGNRRGNGCGVRLHVLEDRGSNQEVAEVRVQVGDHFLGQVVVEVAFGTGQRTYKSAHLTGSPAVHRGLDQGQRGRPSVCSGLEVVQDVRLERVPVRVAEELARLGFVKPEFVATQFK